MITSTRTNGYFSAVFPCGCKVDFGVEVCGDLYAGTEEEVIFEGISTYMCDKHDANQLCVDEAALLDYLTDRYGDYVTLMQLDTVEVEEELEEFLFPED